MAQTTQTPYTSVVTSTAKKVLEDALALPEEDREKVAELLLVGIDHESKNTVQQAWAEELCRRLEDAKAGEGESVPWDQVYRTLRSELIDK